MRPLLVLDLELSGCGRHKEKNRIIAIGACVISPQYIVQKLTSPNVVFSPEDIPEKYKFLRYIHDKEALEEVKDLENPGPIWHEPAGSSFWFKQTPTGRATLMRTLSLMRGSEMDAKESIVEFEKWLKSMIEEFPDVLLASDVSNSDFSWLDHYRLKYLDLNSINFIKGEEKFESPTDLGSYYAGLCGLTNHRNPLQQTFLLICQRYGFQIPKVKVKHDHNPLHDALQLGLQAMYIMVLLSIPH